MTAQDITIRTLPIRLGQLLKLADLVQDGFEARIRITEGEVRVNGAEERRRGRQIVAGDVVEYADHTLTVRETNA